MALHYADLHIHSRFSRATSKDITLPNLEKWAKVKGLSILGAGDFTHPKWLSELKENLAQQGDTGVYATKTGFNFLLSSEISLMYSQGGKSRKVHLVVLSPNFEVVDQINEQLDKWGRRDYDGRPIFGKSCVEFVDSMMAISNDIEVIPAHAWTPHFGVFGSMSGFDSLKECFQEKTKHIRALETGLSSNPAMNWRLSSLDDITLLSFSDSHSCWPWRIGRECTAFELENLTYRNIINAIREKDKKVIKSTIEFFPEEGKYHYDGHRNCRISMDPSEAKKLNNACPVCHKIMTLGVLHRVEELADRSEGFVPKSSIPYTSLIPLSELIMGVYGQSSPNSKSVWSAYNKLINSFSSELNVLLKAPEKALKELTNEKIADAVLLNREGKIKVKPGYDGEYGVPMLDNVKENECIPSSQKSLSEY